MQKEKIMNLIMEQIGKAIPLGEHTGGSGHKAHIGATVDKVSPEPQKDGSIRVTYQVSIFRESEFTVYDEEGPKPDIYEYEMIIKDEKVISNRQTKVIQSSVGVM